MTELPQHLRAPVQFAINSGARDNVVCNLRWEWLKPIAQLSTTVAIVPKEFVKGRAEPKILMLNSLALTAVESQRGQDSEYVFVCQRRVPRKPDACLGPTYGLMETLNNTGWQGARSRASLGDLHVHDLRHTFANRLSAAGVPEVSIATLMWHATKSVTRHYMGANLRSLLEAVETLVQAPQHEDLSVSALIQEHLRERHRGG